LSKDCVHGKAVGPAEPSDTFRRTRTGSVSEAVQADIGILAVLPEPQRASWDETIVGFAGARPGGNG